MKYVDTIRAPIKDTALNEEGFLVIKNNPIAKPGVFPYMTEDGLSMQAKLPEDILSAETIASANGKAVTNDHPPVQVNSKNIKNYGVGMTMDGANIADNMLSVPMVITDPKAIRDIQAGKHELSIGFSADIVAQDGVFDGIKYDHVQRNIRINHVAIVDKGRAGKDVAIRDGMDEQIYYLLDSLEQDTRKEISNMKFKIGDKEIDTSGENAQTEIDAAVKAYCDKQMKAKPAKSEGADSIDAAMKMATGYKADLDRVSGEKSAIEAENKQLKQDAADAEAGFEARVAARVELENKARGILGDSAELPKSEKDIKIAVIKHVNKNIELGDDASMDFINGAYGVAVAGSKTTPNVDINGVKGSLSDAEDELAKAKAARLNLKK